VCSPSFTSLKGYKLFLHLTIYCHSVFHAAKELKNSNIKKGLQADYKMLFKYSEINLFAAFMRFKSIITLIT